MMRKISFGLFACALLLAGAAPVHAQTYFPFGSVNVGQPSSGIRVGPLGCYIETSDPTLTTAQIGPCSITTSGRLRIDTGARFFEEDVHVSGQPGFPMFGVRGPDCVGSALSGGNGRYQPVQFDANGRLCINIGANSSGSLTATDNGTFAIGQTNLAAVINTPYVFNGTAHVRRQGFHLIDNSAFTAGSEGVAVAGYVVDEASTNTVTENFVGAPRMTPARQAIVTAQPYTSGGLQVHYDDDLDNGAGNVIKASPGQLYALIVTNTASSTRWIKLYDATSCTTGTGTPKLKFGMPGNGSDDILAGLGAGGHGVEFTVGICIGASTIQADSDNTAPTAGDVVLNALYK